MLPPPQDYLLPNGRKITFYRDFQGKFISKVAYERLKRAQGHLEPPAEEQASNVQHIASTVTRPRRSEDKTEPSKSQAGQADDVAAGDKTESSRGARDSFEQHTADADLRYSDVADDSAIRSEIQEFLDTSRLASRRPQLYRKNLHKCNLSKMDLHDVDFINVKLTKCNLAEANLRNADLRGQDLRDAKLNKAVLIGANLQGANLANARLVGADLSDANLLNADLAGAWLDDAILVRAKCNYKLVKAHLRGANCDAADFKGADCTGAIMSSTTSLKWAVLETAVLSGAQMNGCDLRWAKMQGAILVDAKLKGANLQEADLSNANLHFADLSGANLEGACLVTTDIDPLNQTLDPDTRWIWQAVNRKKPSPVVAGRRFRRAVLLSAQLAGFDFTQSDLIKADLSGANLTRARLLNVRLDDANLAGADLSEALLQNARLISASLYNAILRNAKLHGADLTNADLRLADLHGADLTGADLTSANFQGANVEDKQMKSAASLEFTVWRDGTVRAKFHVYDVPRVDTESVGKGERMTTPLEPMFAIITALPVEYAAVEIMLENPRDYVVPGRGAGRRYLLGDVSTAKGCKHSIVLSLADMGNNIAATRATLLLEHFSAVNSIIMVGIAGGIPNPEKPDEDIRLGDVVVSSQGGVIQYDFDKETLKGTTADIEHRHWPRPPSPTLLEGVRLLQVAEMKQEYPWIKWIDQISRQLNVARPPDDSDPEAIKPHVEDRKGVKGQPRIFLGAIASANKLLKNSVRRDELRRKFGVKAVEMEGSGIADATWNQETGYLVVRGICDYADERKNDDWQKYAAVVAAAYTRALLESMPC